MQTLGIIESYYPSFTKSEKRIADFIIESNSKVIDLTLSELAVMLNVGEATIVRFCRKMKLKGFQELKFYWQSTMTESSRRQISTNV
ncbi:MurR/RpiR family transcriptional regulator [Bacillales bacterium AN1005]